MLVDANLLLYATDRNSPHHEAAETWLTAALNGERRVGLPWQSLAAFIRISTHPRITARPLTIDQAWEVVEGWLGVPLCWHPEPGPGFGPILGRLLRANTVAGNLVPDAMLAALALEHGLTVFSADSDFARFHDVPWVNPLR
jgi:hypothetical protein